MTGAAPRITWLRPEDPPEAFPAVENAFREPDGLLAAGGDLSEARLIYAYRHGIFPWYDEGQPILWWSPDPRCVIEPAELRISRRNQRAIRRAGFEVTFNRSFAEVIAACAEPRIDQLGTWITPAMTQAYCRLHDAGWAHSVEIWRDNRLVGGMYGIASGQVFFGESMFSRETNASKAAIAVLCRHMVRSGLELLDCQVVSPHLLSLGARNIPRLEFCKRLSTLCVAETPHSLPAREKRPVADILGW